VTALRCRQCGKALAIPSRGPRPTFCSDRCRKAAPRGPSAPLPRHPAAAPVEVVTGATHVRSFGPGPSYGRGLGDGDVCPSDPAHGAMYFFGKSKQWCPHSAHRGNAWYGRGGLTPVSRSAADPDLGGLGRRQSEASTAQAGASLPSSVPVVTVDLPPAVARSSQHRRPRDTSAARSG
jgi:hypothetical protein